jgi:signal transduction histidine kinase
MNAIAGDSVQITVTDKGTGFDAAARAGGQTSQTGSGLYDIERRLGMIGGSIRVTSKPGFGTTVRLSAPLTIGTSPHDAAREFLQSRA